MSRSPKSTNYSLSEEHVQRILRELETARKQAEERVGRGGVSGKPRTNVGW